MSVNLSFENDDGQATLAERLVLEVSKGPEEITVEVYDRDDENAVYCQETIFPESFGLRDDPELQAELFEIKKVFESPPDELTLTIDCHADGLLIEVVNEFEVMTYYRICFAEWGFEVGDGKSVLFG